MYIIQMSKKAPISAERGLTNVALEGLYLQVDFFYMRVHLSLASSVHVAISVLTVEQL